MYVVVNLLVDTAVETEGEPITENGVTYRFVQYINRKLEAAEN